MLRKLGICLRLKVIYESGMELSKTNQIEKELNRTKFGVILCFSL